MADSLASRFRWRAPRVDAASVTVLGLAALAWLTLLVLAASPWARYFSHGALQQLGTRPWAAASMAAGWVLMVVAMMLPTTIPLLALFGRITSRRRDRRSLEAILLVTYLLVWLATGVRMYVGDFGIHRLVERWAWLATHVWIISTTALALAGTYQFTSAKLRCLRRCRSPQSFLRKHWSGAAAHRQAVRIGLDHGAHCVGCCWPLMLVMFSVGVGNLVWMLLLTSLILIEKVTVVGQRASAPIGVGLLAAALMTPFTQ